MSGSRRAAAENSGQPSSDNRSNSARRAAPGHGSSTNAAAASATQPGNSATLTGTGAATLTSPTNYSNQPLSATNIPMAEPSVDINKSERLFPPSAQQDTAVRKSKQPSTTKGRRAGTTESRLDYAVSVNRCRPARLI